MSKIKQEKAFRILAMYDILENDGCLSVDELCNKNNVSKKTVHRDISDLRTYYADQGSIGEEVVVYDKAVNTYHLNKSHKLQFTLEQGLLLYQLIDNCNFINYDEKIKLIKVLHQYVKQQNTFKTYSSKISLNDHSLYQSFSKCYQTLITKQQMIFDYGKKLLKIYPIDIVIIQEKLYLIAADEDGKMKVYDMQEIKNIKQSSKSLNPILFERCIQTLNLKRQILTKFHRKAP